MFVQIQKFCISCLAFVRLIFIVICTGTIKNLHVVSNNPNAHIWHFNDKSKKIFSISPVIQCSLEWLQVRSAILNLFLVRYRLHSCSVIDDSL